LIVFWRIYFSMSDLFLAFDIGTSSSRAMLYDRDGAPVPGASYSLGHQPVTTTDGGSWLDADTLVAEAVVCAENALAGRGTGRIIGVGVSTFWHSAVGVDVQGQAVTPILLWNDSRSAPQVAALRREVDAAANVQRTGCPLHTSFLPGRLRWLAETEPDAFSRCYRFLSPGEYLYARLFGREKVTASISMASASGLFDQTRGVWDEKIIAHLPGMSVDKLSLISDAPVSGLLPPYRDRLPALADVPFFPALGDGACSNIGCGALTPGRLALMIGTSGALRVAIPSGDAPAVPPGLWRYMVGANRFLLGGALTNGGSVWAWLRRTLNFDGKDDDAIEAAVRALPTDGHGLTVLPFLSGERAPLWRDDLHATIHGLSVATTPEEIARAHLEAVAYRFAAVREALLPVAPKGELLGTGAGLLSSPTWAQIISDTLGEPIHLSDEEQASARGAILSARENLGLGKMEDAPPPKITLTVTPDAANTNIYALGRRRQEKFFEAVSPGD
jgi:gluconokinase